MLPQPIEGQGPDENTAGAGTKPQFVPQLVGFEVPPIQWTFQDGKLQPTVNPALPEEKRASYQQMLNP